MAKRNSTTPAAPSSIPSEGKYTCYNRETMDYDGYFNGQYLGSRENMNAARDLVNEYVYDLERSGELYTAEQLDGGADVEAIAADQITVTPIYRDPESGDLTEEPAGAPVLYDFTIGTDLTKVMLGTFGGEKRGVDLIIGGTCINDYLHQVITLADVRTLRDNLDTLLADPRVRAACVQSEAVAA